MDLTNGFALLPLPNKTQEVKRMDSSFHYNLNSLREAALTVLREVDSLTSRDMNGTRTFGLQEEVQRYEIELIKSALQRTRGNQRRAARLLGVKVTTLNCKIKRFGISIDDGSDLSVVG